MSLFFPEEVPPVVNNGIARVERQLPRSSELQVRVGNRVEPDDIIARGSVPGQPQLVNVAQALGLLPAQVYGAMRKEEGNKVAAGEVIARSGLIGGRSCQAPIAGTITLIDRTTGYVAITPESTSLELRANVRGIVMEVSDSHVVIETPAALVNGVAGVGPDRFGVLRLLVTDPGEVVDAALIDARSAYAIIIAGAGITAAALQRAVQEQVRGVIVGGIPAPDMMSFMGEAGASLFQLGQRSWALSPNGYDPGLTLIITEGFGIHRMSRPIFELLAAHDQQEALIQGATQIRSPLIKPRLVIPLARSRASSEVTAPQVALAPGIPVRLLDEAHLGQVGTLVSLSSAPDPLASGARGLTATVQLPQGERVVIARTAVEAMASS